MAMPTQNLIDDMSYPELEAHAHMVHERMHELRENGLEKLHAELEEKAANLGYSLAELMAIAKKRKRRTRAKDNGAQAHPE